MTFNASGLLPRGACALLLVLAGCSGLVPHETGLASRLAGNKAVLLGEIHDHAGLHERRLALLQRAIRAGWRPALIMEQFDIDRQADIDRARSERPGDVSYLIEQATLQPNTARSGWNWDFYRPLVALALEFELPLIAGNLSRAEASRLIRTPVETVLGVQRSRELGLTEARDAAWQRLQERAIDDGHCGLFPAELMPGMAMAQFARDAIMADLIRQHLHRGVVLLAGNGHVRRDLGVPRWLNDLAPARLLVVGFVPRPIDAPPSDWSALYDVVVEVAHATSPVDPCGQLATTPK